MTKKSASNGQPAKTQAKRKGTSKRRSADREEDGFFASEEYQDAMRRAEELVDRAAEQLRPLATRVGKELQKLAARLREEADDVWAEAQHLRNQKRP